MPRQSLSRWTPERSRVMDRCAQGVLERSTFVRSLCMCMALFTLTQSACSFVQVTRVDEGEPLNPCTTSNKPAASDLVSGIMLTGLATLTTYISLDDPDGWATVTGPVAGVSGGLAALMLASATYGFVHAGACRDHYRAQGRPIPSESLSCTSMLLSGAADGPASFLVSSLLCGVAAGAVKAGSGEYQGEGDAPHSASGGASKTLTPSRLGDRVKGQGSLRIERLPPEEEVQAEGNTPLKVSPPGKLDVDRCVSSAQPTVARCADGSVSCAKKRESACRSRGGVEAWLEER